MRRKVAMLVLAVVLVGCSDDNGDATTEPLPANTRQVTMNASAFLSADLTISAGTTVRWTNTSSIFHDVTSETDAWRQARLQRGETFEHTFTTPGTYRYRCTPHSASFTSGMVGVIRVQ